MWLHFRESAAQHRCVTEIALKSSFLCVKRSPIWYGFRAGAKAVRYSVNTCPICDLTLEKAWRSIAALQKSRWNHRSYVWTEALSGMVFVPAQKLSSSITVWTGSLYAHSSGAFNCFVLAAKVIFQNCVWQGEIHNYISGTQRVSTTFFCEGT